MKEPEYLKLDNRGQTSVEVILLIGSILVQSFVELTSIKSIWKSMTYSIKRFLKEDFFCLIN